KSRLRVDLEIEAPDLNELIEGPVHEARVRGTVRFERFEGGFPAVFAVDRRASALRYRPAGRPGVGGLGCRLVFEDSSSRAFVLEGTAPEDGGGAFRSPRERLAQWTTLAASLRSGAVTWGEASLEAEPGEPDTGGLGGLAG